MTSDSPTVFDMLTHDENQTVPKKPSVPYGYVLDANRAQALRALEYQRQKNVDPQYVLPLFET